MSEKVNRQLAWSPPQFLTNTTRHTVVHKNVSTKGIVLFLIVMDLQGA